MRIPSILLIALLLSATLAFGQRESQYKILFNNGAVTPKANLDEGSIVPINQKISKEPMFFVLQFNRIPDVEMRQRLAQSGIRLLEYLQGNAYTAWTDRAINTTLLKEAGARSLVQLDAAQKTQPGLLNGIIPAWALPSPGMVDCWISFPSTYTSAAVRTLLAKNSITLNNADLATYRILEVRIATDRLAELASFPFIEYVQAKPKEAEELNDHSTVNSRANVLQAPADRNLTGAGIVLGVGDNNDPLTHIDLAGRIINRSPNLNAAHGMHVMGTAGGGGIVREKQRGFAPDVTIVAQAFSNILVFAPEYVQDYRMVITNNSYGNVTNDCATFGVYDLYSRVMDQQAFQMPHLQHVFAAGNSGAYSCAPYPAGFSNVLGAYQSSKNVICVGNGSELGVIAPSSSKGPVRDGRIKPEITAQGTNVLSDDSNNGYYYNSGTSMASPAVSGGLTLLYQRYRQLNGDADPLNGLMKALLLNGADDRGNPGPDYTFGFGWMNLLRSVTMLEQHNYITTSVAPGATNTHTLVMSAGSQIAQLKVMLYWNDSAANVFAQHALVNDLDLVVNDASSTDRLPFLLDTLPANVNNTAVTGADHVNNVEQVVISNPVAGTYTFRVSGTTIPLGAGLQYYLVYDTIPVSAKLVFPVGGEHVSTNEPVYISWDSYGSPASDYTLQYSPDNGATWSNIQVGISPSARLYNWTTPAVATDQARIKLIQNGTGVERISGAFTILGVPALSLSSTQCPGYIGLSWTAVPGATDYEIMQLKGTKMQPVGTTTATAYAIPGLSIDSVYWVSVRARINGNAGRRADAVTRIPNSGTCAGTISDNDVRLKLVVSPSRSGRLFTSREFTSTTPVKIRITNLDDASTTGNIDVSYRVNGGAYIHETIIAPNIAAGADFDYTFTSTANLSIPGDYALQFAIVKTGDPVAVNDSISVTVSQLNNSPLDLITDHTDDFESMPVSSFGDGKIGLTGADRYDFSSTTALGRVRSFVNSGLAPSGNQALTVDASRYNAGGTTDTLTATFNLSAYNAPADDIRLDFLYKQHGQLFHPANNVWIRGNDQQPWILAYNLDGSQADLAQVKKTSSIELGDLLLANGQNYSSSFQAKFGQWGQHLTADDYEAAGYTFDNVHVYRVVNDIQGISIDAPGESACQLGPNSVITATLRNSANTTVTSIPVKYQVDGGTIVSENIASINANTSVSYSFSATANLAAPGRHSIRVWSDLASDNFHENDTVTISMFNSPLITAYPYLQDFESGDGYWYPAGILSTWQYGTPASNKINRAASGTKAWKTSLVGNYNDGESSYLYSPCFNLTGLVNPTLSFSLALDIEDCGATLCDEAYVEYSTDGASWSRLGTSGAGTNWYNKNYAGDEVWSIQNYTRWHVATIPLPVTGDVSRVRIRFAMQSDPGVSREGVGIDDVHIYDNVNGIYPAPPAISQLITRSPVNGNNWTDFTDGGRLIASVNANGQDLGSTDAQAFINTGSVRVSSQQYYHDRNIVIKPTNTALTDSATVRFYFTDAETEALINATGCSSCAKPASAYDLGVSKYTDIDKTHENGNLGDDLTGSWIFMQRSKIRIVPFDKGYYAEFKVKNFSEFWLNTGGPGQNQPLPVHLSGFTAKKTPNGKDVVLDWVTAAEESLDKFVVEVARSNQNYTNGDFEPIGEVAANGNPGSDESYTYTDIELNKSGARYYRLKLVNQDGGFTYSEVRPVVFRNEVSWQVYPNPSSGLFNVVYQADAQTEVTMRLFDATGRVLRSFRVPANGFIDKYILDLSSSVYAAGMYMLEVRAGETQQAFRLMKR